MKTFNAESPSSAIAFGTGAILVGDPGAVPDFFPARFDSILWIADHPDPEAVLPGVAASAVHTVALAGLVAADAWLALDRWHLRAPFAGLQLFVAPEGSGVVAHVRAWFEDWQREQSLLQRVGYARQKHFLLNVTEYVRRQVPASWAGALRGLPAFVCGSGPSLDVSVAALARVADGGVVIAADTALRTLARHGVVADFAVSVSSRKPPELCLAPEAEPMRVILSTLSPPAWREVIAPDRRYFLSRAHPTEDWLAEQGVSRTPVMAVLNCAITELELARFLGCAPIHLFGVDFATDAGSPSVGCSADADPTIERDALPATWARVPGNYAADVPVLNFGDWQACDARLATWPADLAYNVNDRGARLRHTRLIDPRKFVLDGQYAPKRPALARLAAPVMEQDDAVRLGFAALGAQGVFGCRAMAGLRRTLEHGGASALVEDLRRLFGRVEFARALGSLTKKLVPHLGRSPELDGDFWPVALDELEEACCLAESVYSGALV